MNTEGLTPVQERALAERMEARGRWKDRHFNDKKPWTAQDDHDLTEMIMSKGMNRKDAAKKLGRSYDAVGRRCSVLKLLPPRDNYGGKVVFKAGLGRSDEELVSGMQARDARFLRALALAFQRGDHLPRT